MRGTPSRPFLADATPDKWKVFRVSCVVGSPIDWAATTPTISEGLEIDFKNWSWIFEHNKSKACLVKFLFMIKFLGFRNALRSMFSTLLHSLDFETINSRPISRILSNT